MSRADLSPRDRELVETIERLADAQGYPPTVRELADAARLSGPSVVHGALLRLREEGVVTWQPSRPRTLRVVA